MSRYTFVALVCCGGERTDGFSRIVTVSVVALPPVVGPQVKFIIIDCLVAAVLAPDAVSG